MHTIRFALLAMIAVSSLVAALAQPVPQGPAGLWGNEAWFGPAVRGEILVDRGDAAWTIRVAGLELSVPRNGDDLRATFPGGQGELRVRLEERGSVLRGFWTQPRGNFGQYASPLRLARVRDGVWRGTITPLDDRMSLYLLIEAQADGSLRGVFRNPEVNWNGGAPWWRVTEEGEALKFTDPRSGKTRYVQPYDGAQRKISMDFGVPIALTPRSREDAVGYVPRSPASSYTYRVPVAGDDGWTVARARDAGLDERRLSEFVTFIMAADPARHDAPRIHSLLIARHGKLVLDEYFYGWTADRPHDLRSASKTFTSVLAGIAMEQQRSLKLDTPIAPSRTITLAHLLTHTSGLACDDSDEASPGQEDTMQSQQQQPDWYRYFADLPVIHEPGRHYAYCSAGINFAAGMVAKATGQSLLDFFERQVARPLQMQRYFVNLMPNGEAYGAGGVYMRPRDLLKLGQTYLAGGVWNGKRIVSKEWVARSTAHQVDVIGNGSDGYGWHRHELTSQGRRYATYEASGNGGQFLIVVPELDMVVVITAGNYSQYNVWRTFRDELVPQYLLPVQQAH